MTPEQLAAIRERAEAIDLGEPASLISTLAVDAHKDRAALLDHVDRLQTALDAAHLTSLDLLGHRNQLAGQLFAVRELHVAIQGLNTPYCAECNQGLTTTSLLNEEGIPYPCPTIQAADGETTDSDTAN